MPAGGGFTPRSGIKYSTQEYADAGMIESFRMKAREWNSRVQRLQAMPVPASMQAEKNRLLSLASSVRSAIEKVTSALDAVGMSAVPLIAVAVIAAAVGAIAWWNSSYDKFVTEARKVTYEQRYKEFIAQGLSPEQANSLALQAASELVKDSDTGPLAFVMRHWQMIAVGLGALFIYNQFFRKR